MAKNPAFIEKSEEVNEIEANKANGKYHRTYYLRSN